MTDNANSISIMNSSPKEQFLKFILDRGAQLYTIVTDADKENADCEAAFLALCSFIPDAHTRSDLVRMYFEERKKFSSRAAAILCTGPCISAIATSMDVTESSAGAFI